MIIVTGDAGLIGSNLIKALHEQGYPDLLAVDPLKRGDQSPQVKRSNYLRVVSVFKCDLMYISDTEASPTLKCLLSAMITLLHHSLIKEEAIARIK